MNKRFAVGAAVVFVVVAGAWVWKSFVYTAMPHDVPSDFALTWQSGGGMIPSGEEVDLRGVNGAVKIWDASAGSPVSQTDSFTLTNDQLVTLYAFLRANRADQMAQASGVVYDGDNDGYRMSWGDTSIDVSGILVANRDRDRFGVIFDGLTQTFAPYIPLLTAE